MKQRFSSKCTQVTDLMERIKALQMERAELKANLQSAHERELQTGAIHEQSVEHLKIEWEEKYEAIRTRYLLLEEAYNNLLK